jgi:glycosyltransferase involved in cell wall biosynthesis
MLAIIYNNGAPYFAARLAAAGRRGPIRALPLAVAEPWDEQAVVPIGTAVFTDQRGHRTATEIRESVDRVLTELRPDMLALHGWSRRCSLAAMSWAASNGVPIVMLGEFQTYGRPPSSFARHIKRRLFRLCRAFLVGGSSHADYLRTMGVPGRRIFTGYDVVDNAHFARIAQHARRYASNLRAQLGLPDKFFLTVSRLVPEKNLLFVLESYARYIAQTRDTEVWPLVMVGEGPMFSRILECRGRLGLEQHVRLVGWKSYEELPVYYGLASVFVHASTFEPWGLVVNEALAAGLPVLLSRLCSCMPDLVIDGVNGYTFDPLDAAMLAGQLLGAARGEYDLEGMGHRGTSLISGFSPDVFAENFWNAADVAGGQTTPGFSLTDRLLLRVLIHRPGAPD